MVDRHSLAMYAEVVDRDRQGVWYYVYDGILIIRSEW